MQCRECEKCGKCSFFGFYAPLRTQKMVNLEVTKYGIVCSEFVEHEDENDDNYTRR